MKSVLVSIIVPAYNEAGVLPRLFRSIKRQTYKRIETILVDDASTDSTFTLAKRFTRYVYSRRHSERSIQRNFGAKKARGKYLLFLDADMKLSPFVVAECVEKAIGDEKIGAIVIPELSVAKSFWGKVKAFERSFYNKDGDDITDSARFFSRAAFEKAGGYDASITGPEDWDLPETVKKNGYKVGRIKALIYHYERVPNPIKLASKKFYYGLKSHRYLSKQNIPIVGPKTIYFLRPVFYKHWRDLMAHPTLTMGMIIMMTLELVGGGLGYILGKLKNA